MEHTKLPLEYWEPVLTDAAYCARLREDYPERAHLTDEELVEYYNHGRKYQCLWDHVGDAYEDWEKLADAYLKGASQHERLVEALKFYMSICGNTCNSVSRETAQEMYAMGQAVLDACEVG